MNLPQDFHFNQANLQDFADCRRRFFLRHLQRLAWPAIETEPVLEHERYLQQGVAFHRLAQQCLLGIPLQRLPIQISDPDLGRWWQNFLEVGSELLEMQANSGWKLYPEISLSAPLTSSRIVAKYDLVAVSPEGMLRIYDWKTSRSKTRREWLERRLQTHVYPYVLCMGGAHLSFGKPLQPEQIEMLYWFAEYPDQGERFLYNAAALQSDREYLISLEETIHHLQESEFYLTSDEKRCAFCTYRSLCNRGISAGSAEDLQLDTDDHLQEIVVDFEQIAEIEF
jgi:CRISPR/Cas system-associated exonuclease Cas4 (RecB family)